MRLTRAHRKHLWRWLIAAILALSMPGWVAPALAGTGTMSFTANRVVTRYVARPSPPCEAYVEGSVFLRCPRTGGTARAVFVMHVGDSSVGDVDMHLGRGGCSPTMRWAYNANSQSVRVKVEVSGRFRCEIQWFTVHVDVDRPPSLGTAHP